MRFLGSFALAITLAALVPAHGAFAQEKVKPRRIVTAEVLETILKDLDLAFKKTVQPKNRVVHYEFEKHGHAVRLSNYDGKDLWLSVIFADALPLETINRWNAQSRFSRAVLVQGKDGAAPTVTLEVQFDCFGGVTDGMIRRLVQRFDQDLQAFLATLKK